MNHCVVLVIPLDQRFETCTASVIIGMAASSMIDSPLHSVQFCALPDDPYHSPAKRFAPEGRNNAAVKVITATAVQDQDEEIAELLRIVPKKVDHSRLTVLKRYQLYEPVLQVYSAVCRGKYPTVRFTDEATKCRAYQVVFDLLHHCSVMEEMLNESGFFARNFDLHSHEMLVLIMAYDFQREKFCLRPPRDQESRNKISQTVLRIAEALWKHKVKLGATLARMRVKANAKTITHLVADELRQKYERAVREPYYARVNPLKVANVQVEVVARLHGSGYTVVSRKEHLAVCERAVYQPHRDLLAFSPDCRACLWDEELVKEGILVIQDLTSYTLVENLKHYLQGSDRDVIVTDCGAGVEVAHVAGILGGRGTVFAFGALPSQMEGLQQRMMTMEVNNVRFIQAPFVSVSPGDELLERVGVVVCLPPSSLSAVTQPLDFILQEGDCHVPTLLGQTSQAPNLRTLNEEQRRRLTHALTFHQARAVVYGTRSCQEAENGALVKGVHERHRAMVQEGKTTREYRLQPLPAEEPVGGFMAVFERQLQPYKKPGPAAKEVIAQAIARGILTGDGITPQKQIKRPKKTKTRVFSHHDGIPMTIAAAQKVVKKKEIPPSPKRAFR